MQMFMIIGALLPGRVAAGEDMLHDLYINEVMMSTFGGQLDGLMEFPDSWVELYNPSDVDISLDGYGISKKKSLEKCYTLPDVTVPAGGYVVIYCDKEDKFLEESSEIHTDFKLSTDGGNVYLYNAEDELVDHVTLPEMPAPGVAWGRSPDGSANLGWQMEPTPANVNSYMAAKGVMPSPTFSTGSYLVAAAPGEQTIRCKVFIPKSAPEGTVIRYTTDSTDPTESSPILDGTLYIKENTVLKAALFASGYATPAPEQRVFLFHGRDITLPVISVATCDDYIYDEAIGLYPNNSVQDNNHNWRRPATLDYFPMGSSSAALTQKCEVRLGGAYTRAGAGLKTMIAYANDRFGTNDYFTAQFFPETCPEVLFTPSVSFRNSGNDYGYSNIRDAVLQVATGMNCDVDWQAAQPCIYYLNGEYKGLLNIRERSNEDNVWTHYNGLEDITVVENTVTKQGDATQYAQLVDFFNNGVHSYAEYDEVIDVKEFANVMIANTYMTNTDFPGNNNSSWRLTADGGRWRWIIKDTDFGFGIWGSRPATYNYINWVTHTGSYTQEGANSDKATLFIRKMMQVPEFRELFLELSTVYLGDFFTYEYIAGIMTWFQTQMDTEYPYYQQVQSLRSYSSWVSEINNMKKWAKDRPKEMYKHLKDFFSTGAMVAATVNCDILSPDRYTVSINDINLATHTFDGYLYAGRTYTIQGSYDDSVHEMLGWEVQITEDGVTRTETVYGTSYEITPTEGMTGIKVNSIRGTAGVPDPETLDKPIESVVYYNVVGIPQATPWEGLNIVRYTFTDGTTASEKKVIR